MAEKKTLEQFLQANKRGSWIVLFFSVVLIVASLVGCWWLGQGFMHRTVFMTDVLPFDDQIKADQQWITQQPDSLLKEQAMKYATLALGQNLAVRLIVDVGVLFLMILIGAIGFFYSVSFLLFLKKVKKFDCD